MNPPSTDLQYNFQFTKMTVHSTAFIAFGLICIINWERLQNLFNTVKKAPGTLLRLSS